MWGMRVAANTIYSAIPYDRLQRGGDRRVHDYTQGHIRSPGKK